MSAVKPVLSPKGNPESYNFVRGFLFVIHPASELNLSIQLEVHLEIATVPECLSLTFGRRILFFFC